jgi:hypothetical protein
MSWTKEEFVAAAFDELGLTAFFDDLEEIQKAAALKKLDAMMATWNGIGLRIGYPIPSSPENSSLDDETNVPDVANEAIFLSLAVRVAPSYGKVVSRETKVSAKNAYNALLSKNSQILEFKLPTTMPIGQGSQHRYQTFISPPETKIDNGKDSELEIN